MKLLRLMAGLLCVSVLFFASGCAIQPPGDGAVVDKLTDQQKAVADSVAAQVEAITTALAGMVDSFDGIEAEGSTAFGECPTVNIAVDGGTLLIALAFSENCTNAYFGDSPVSGNIVVMFNTQARTFDVTFDAFVTASGTVNGTMALGFERDGLAAVLTGTMDISISGVGSSSGDITLKFDAESDTITIAQATLNLTAEDDTAFAVAIDNIIVRPIDNGNFIPESGSITFDIPNEGPGPDTIAMSISFDNESPADNTVSVQIGTADPIEYELPVV